MSRSCGKCGGMGHNRRTCTSVSTSFASKPVESNSVNARTASGRRKAKCTYCAKTNFTIDRTHTSRTCSNRKNDLIRFIKENSEWAKKYKQEMKECGFGIGAIVERYDRTYMIESIDWENICMKDQYGGITGLKLEGLNEPRYFNRSNICPPIKGKDYDNITMVSPIPGELVEKQFPPDWEKGMYGIPDRLRDTDTRRKSKK
jgi:hypothetical protein